MKFIKNIKFSFVILSLCLYAVNTTVAQRGYKLEIGGMTGLSNYLGEIGGVDQARKSIADAKMNKSKWNVVGYIKYKVHPQFFVRGEVNYLRIEGDDALCINVGRKNRNLSFRNDIFDVETTVHWLFYSSSKPAGVYSRVSTYLGAYLFSGFGVLHHSPKTIYQGQIIDLQPLKTEGVLYSKIAVCIPFGAGFYVAINHGRKSHRLGIEFNYRLTTTDYLDDVSSKSWMQPGTGSSSLSEKLNNRNPELTKQPDGASANFGWVADPKNPDVNLNKAPRGNPGNKDGYFSINVTYGIALKGKYTRSRGRKIRSITF